MVCSLLRYCGNIDDCFGIMSKWGNIFFREGEDFRAGAVFVVDKPLHWTSFDVVNKVRICLRKGYGKIKVGHAGTLDPLASDKEDRGVYGTGERVRGGDYFRAYDSFL